MGASYFLNDAFLAPLLSGLGFLLAFWQFRKGRTEEFHARRPYVVPSLSTKRDGKEIRLYLTLENVGASTAQNVVVRFEDGKPWHYVSNPSYPFLEQNKGISVIAPGKSFVYFLGVITRSNELRYLYEDSIAVTVRADAGFRGRKVKDTYRLTLQDHKFLSRR